LGLESGRSDNPSFIISASLAARVAAIALLIWPHWPVFACCLLLPFNFVGGIANDITTPFVSVAKLVVDTTFVFALMGVALAQRSRLQLIVETPLGRSVLALIALIGLSTLVGFVSLGNSGRVADWVRESNWLWFYAFFIPVAAFIDSRRRLLALVAVLAVGVVAAELTSLWIFAVSPRYLRSDWAGGVSFQRALFSEPSVFIMFLAFVEVFILWPRSSISGKLLLATVPVFGLLIVGLAANLGRALWLSSAIGFILLLPFVPRTRRTLAITVTLLLPALLVVPVTMNALFGYLGSGQDWITLSWNFFLRIGSSDDVSVIGRQIEWTNAITAWLGSPIVGVGLGAPYPVTPLNNPYLAPFYLHNSFLNLLAKLGLFGAVAFVAVIVLTLRELTRGYSLQTDAHMKAITLAAAAALIQILVYSLTSPAITTSDSVMFAAVLLGLAFSTSRVSHNQIEPTHHQR
jgi:O-antigen ligase